MLYIYINVRGAVASAPEDNAIDKRVWIYNSTNGDWLKDSYYIITQKYVYVSFSFK